jgi:hypothetical protein
LATTWKGVAAGEERTVTEGGSPALLRSVLTLHVDRAVILSIKAQLS